MTKNWSCARKVPVKSSWQAGLYCPSQSARFSTGTAVDCGNKACVLVHGAGRMYSGFHFVQGSSKGTNWTVWWMEAQPSVTTAVRRFLLSPPRHSWNLMCTHRKRRQRNSLNLFLANGSVVFWVFFFCRAALSSHLGPLSSFWFTCDAQLTRQHFFFFFRCKENLFWQQTILVIRFGCFHQNLPVSAAVCACPSGLFGFFFLISTRHLS